MILDIRKLKALHENSVTLRNRIVFVSPRLVVKSSFCRAGGRGFHYPFVP